MDDARYMYLEETTLNAAGTLQYLLVRSAHEASSESQITMLIL